MESGLVILLFMSFICKFAELISVSLAISYNADQHNSFIDYNEIINVQRLLSAELIFLLSLILWFFAEMCGCVERQGRKRVVLKMILCLLKLVLSIAAVSNSSLIIRGYCVTAVIASAAHFLFANCCCCCYAVKK